MYNYLVYTVSLSFNYRLLLFHYRLLDILLLFNMVHSTTSFQNSENWTPVCLPDFDNR